MKIKITYIISDIDKALSFEWNAAYLDKEKFIQRYILLNPGNSDLEEYLRKENIDVERIIYKGKKDIPRALFSIYKNFKKNKPDIVHAHLFEASLLGLFIARYSGIRTRIYTRHHSNSNHSYAAQAVKYDKWINRNATDIIAISKNVRHVLVNLENVNPEKIHLIYHGLDFKVIDSISSERIDTLVAKYRTSTHAPVIGVISRYIHLKGVQYIIPAFKKLLKQYPDAYLILANSIGFYQDEIKKLLQEIPPQNFIELEFEKDLFAFYKLFDIYIHVPIDETCEAFGLTYIEALASKVPSIFTQSGIASEFIQDNENALVVNFKDSEAIFQKITLLLNNKELCAKITDRGYNDVKNQFKFENTIKKLELLYTTAQNNAIRKTGT